MAFDAAVQAFGVDAYSDATTGRGSGNDRAGRPQGGQAPKSPEALLALYKSNGAMQRIVNAPADDATRKGFKVLTDDPQDDVMIQQRWSELDLQSKFRDLVKFMQIYPQGSALFIGLLASEMERQRDFGKPMPPGILEVDFVNSLNHPGDFTVQSVAVNDPTMREFDNVFFRISGKAVHPSWVLWLVSEWDKKDGEGISRVNSTYDAVVAQDSALWSVSTMVQQLSVTIYESSWFTGMKPTKKQEMASKIRNFMETNSFWGIKKGEKVDRLDYHFQGLKDILDFIFQNIALYSQIPQNILIGRAQGILTAAEEDTINYYSFINQFQKSKLERLYRRMIDILLTEQRGELWKKHHGKLLYEIEWLPLWELAPSLKAEIELSNSKRDLTDVQSGKVTSSEELRQRDPFYSMIDKEAELEGKEDDDTNRAGGASQGAKPDADKPEGDADPGVSLASKAKVIPGKERLTVRFHDHEEIDFKTWEEVVLDAEAGVFASKARLKAGGEPVFFEIIFTGDRWTQEKAITWIDFNVPAMMNSATADGNIIGLDEIEGALRRSAGEWDKLPRPERDKKKISVQVVVDGVAHEHRLTGVSKKEGIYMGIGRANDGPTKVVSFWFDKKKWTDEKAKAWVEDKGFKPI